MINYKYMASYGYKSNVELNTAHPDLQVVFREVIKVFDNTIVYGNRSIATQFVLYKSGRSFINGTWVVTDKNLVVTNCDGINIKSNHNYTPSRAVDAIPYPIDWNDVKRMHYFAGFVMCTAIRLKEEGKITHDIRWGGDWDRDTQVGDETFMDFAHFELIT
jgi:peptidoglycan L-alanyl-D-glutamate endopeptidase CwlK